ncbi:MAG TPA: hypothetical protein VGK13_03395 [Methanocellaceae archaeon]
MQGEKDRPLVIGTAFLFTLAFISLLFIASTASASASSTVHGNVYQWSSFDTMKNVEVVVNSVPVQKIVSKDGSYSFNLTKGTFAIEAMSGAETPDALYARENVTITQDGGDYILDLILFPSTNLDNISVFDENYTAIPPDEPGDSQGSSLLLGVTAIVVIAVVAVIAAVFLLMRRKKKAEPATKSGQTEVMQGQVKNPEEGENLPPTVAEQVWEPAKPSVSENYTLPEDLKEVIRIMEKHGGRMTQLDLRKSLPYSEAKVSLMISDLESRGIVKKIKKGRGNILILSTQDSSG